MLILTLGYNQVIILYLLVKASSLDKQMPTRGRVAPRLGRVPPIRQINCSLYPIVVILSVIGHYGIKSSLFFRTFAFRIKNVRHKAIDYQ